jgi:hypothetical protein
MINLNKIDLVVYYSIFPFRPGVCSVLVSWTAIFVCTILLTLIKIAGGQLLDFLWHRCQKLKWHRPF